MSGVAADGLDAAARVPFLPWLYVLYGWGLSGWPEAGAIAFSLTRTVTLAP